MSSITGTSNGRPDREEKIAPAGSDRLELPTSDGLLSPSQRRLSTETTTSTTTSWVDLGDTQLRVSDSANPNPAGSASVSAIPQLSSLAEPHERPLTSSIITAKPIPQDPDDDIDQQEKRGSSTELASRLQDRFLGVAEKFLLEIQQDFESRDDVSQLKSIFEKLKSLTTQPEGQTTESREETLVQEVVASHDTPEPYPLHKASPIGEPDAESCVDIEDIIDIEHSKEARTNTEGNDLDVDVADYAELYYEYASKARYLSDDLINLGPQPKEDHLPQADDDYGSGLGAYAAVEHAQRHLELLDGIADARAQAEKYKQLCHRHDIKLDGDDDNDGNSDLDTDSQNEDLYRSLLSERESGAPRIDAMITVKQAQGAAVTTASPSRGPLNDSTIIEWAAGLGRVNEVPTITLTEDNEPLDGREGIGPRTFDAVFPLRRPSRRLSTSNISDSMADSPTHRGERSLPFLA